MFAKRFYDYNSFLKYKFGQKIYKISLDAGFSCPNIDGTKGYGGCIYCNNKSFSPAHRYRDISLKDQIEIGKKVGKRYKAKKFIAYFQAHTNTHANVEKLEKIYQQVLQDDDIVGIAIGTRPEAVNKEKIELLQSIAEKYFVSIEYGVQSINNDTLKWINRQHTYQDFEKAMKLTTGKDIHICAHIMLGFPNENRKQIIETSSKMNRIGINGIKLHNLLITKDTELEKLYQKEKFHLFGFEDYVKLVCDFVERLSPKIVCERLYANTSDDFLIAPKWNKSSVQILDAIVNEFKQRNSFQGFKYIDL